MGIKFFHSADLHLDSPLRGLERYPEAPSERIRGATRRAFKNLIDACLEENAQLLLIAGDLFDGEWQDYSTGLFFAAQLGRLREGGVEVVWLRGNHDAASKIRKSLVLPPNVHELSVRRPETREFSELGVAVHGQGYSAADTREDLAARYPRALPGYFNIGVLHTSLNGRPGHEPYASCSIETLIDRGYDYWALGHVHEREVVQREPLIVFPGNLQGRHVRETGPKGATLVQVDAGRIAEVQARAFDVVRWERLSVDATDARSAEDVIDGVRAELTRLAKALDGRLLAVRVEIAGASAAHAALARRPDEFANQIRAAAVELSEGEVWVEKVRVRTSPALDLAELRQRHDAIGSLAAALARVRSDASELDRLGEDLRELVERLPPELREGPDGIGVSDGSALGDLVDGAERLLLSRLAGVVSEEGSR
ncbi:MAG: metallophosphoesterase family protein [Myxococcota bacterium]